MTKKVVPPIPKQTPTPTTKNKNKGFKMFVTDKSRKSSTTPM